ncbi:hypothetical protein HY490_01925 [Candidatus Woesearchaeota archaeon]|nr:hypothetical protein [Candidatus Woesearchaeota archaeon]
MHYFVGKCGSEEVLARFPDLHDAQIIQDHVSDLLQEMADELPDAYAQALRLWDDGSQQDSIDLLVDLFAEFPNNYLVAFTLGNKLQDYGRFFASVRVLANAFKLAPHATMKIQTLSRSMLDWKIMGQIHTAKGDVQMAQVHFDCGVVAYREAHRYSYAATLAEAITVEYNHASLLTHRLLMVVGAHQASEDKTDNRQSAIQLLYRARAATEVSRMVCAHYKIQGMDSNHKDLENGLDSLEMKVCELKA